MGYLRTFLVVAACSCLGGYATTTLAASIGLRTGTFDHLVVQPTTGRVGYHMHARLTAWDWDTPTGSLATCDWRVEDVTIIGDLPPGLTLLQHQGDDGIDGTPRQPGDWDVSYVVAKTGCDQGAATTIYGPRTVSVHFHITP